MYKPELIAHQLPVGYDNVLIHTVIHDGKVVFASHDRDLAVAHLEMLSDNIASNCEHESYKVTQDEDLLYMECLACGLVWETAVSDCSWVEIGRQP